MKWFWKFVHVFWPSILRSYEVLFHHHRQDFLIGYLSSQTFGEDLKIHLIKYGFEHAIIALRDPGEILDMRKREGKEFQYHIRLFDDGEVRAHYEYAPEAHPIDHCFEVRMEAKREYFLGILKGYVNINRT